jgi:hypothetical protein
MCGIMSLRWCRRTGIMVRGAVALIRRVLHDLEVGYVSFIINACAGA